MTLFLTRARSLGRSASENGLIDDALLVSLGDKTNPPYSSRGHAPASAIAPCAAFGIHAMCAGRRSNESIRASARC